MAMLEVREVTKRFGGIVANSDVSLSVGEWEIVGLIGPNGAGKTTLFNCITGIYPANSGAIYFRDKDITRMKPHERANLGIGRSFQNLGLVRGQTVLQNLITAQHMTADYTVVEGLVGAPASFHVEKDLVKRADRILDFIELKPYRDEVIDDLPYGILKNVELGAVLATDPQILLLDEPSSGLSPTESDHLGDILLRLRKEIGVTILMIEHHVPLVVRVCDYVYVLNFGNLLTEGVPRDVQQHPEVIAAYLGGEAPSNGDRPKKKPSRPKREPAVRRAPVARTLAPAEPAIDLGPYRSPEGLSEYVPYGRGADGRSAARKVVPTRTRRTPVEAQPPLVEEVVIEAESEPIEVAMEPEIMEPIEIEAEAEVQPEPTRPERTSRWGRRRAKAAIQEVQAAAEAEPEVVDQEVEVEEIGAEVEEIEEAPQPAARISPRRGRKGSYRSPEGVSQYVPYGKGRGR